MFALSYRHGLLNRQPLVGATAAGIGRSVYAWLGYGITRPLIDLIPFLFRVFNSFYFFFFPPLFRFAPISPHRLLLL